MDTLENKNQRRNFIKNVSMIGGGLLLPFSGMAGMEMPKKKLGLHEFGPRKGYAPEISILVSMMDWMRATVLRSVRGLSVKELDFLLDDEANSIGAMLMHLAATEKYYQIHTFENKPWGSWSEADEKRWDVAMGLGDKGRLEIKGNPLSYYTDALAEVRDQTKELLKGKTDDWLMESTKFFGNQSTNNYCKWFHVVEHESNHNGQIKFIKGRM
ncbi:DinB family protein [Sediminicola luteus]|uniref:DUF664 domain-containing protein n=1 Tax=Sediminicola luteus TaxID=319238 RepID=A0A2A4GDC6_9FLAO|nr:DinB family protein [Sediminicola luteus]PCE65752.1 hypothetical protein B7P33_00145 [Sediminicola luteus]